jgi:glutaredoxin 3
MTPLTLYYRPTCPYCVKVLDFLSENKITEITFKDISKNPEYVDELIDIGDKKQVPCLIIDETPLYESSDIIAWFKEHYLMDKKSPFAPIEDLIKQAIPDSTVYILDPQKDGQHLEALVISASFEEIPVFKQQKQVMDAIAGIFDKTHAMALKTFTPEQWEVKKENYVEIIK